MTIKANHILTWTPRILSILFTLFLSLFSLDVFNEGYPFLEMIIAFFMHNIPTLFFGLVTYIGWKNAKLGGILFIILALLTIFAFDTYEHILSLLIITIIPLIIGILFVLKKENSTNHI